jgi:hypothetical protein
MNAAEEIAIRPYFKTGVPAVLPGAIVLINPKYAHNVGQVLRMAADYLSPQVWCSGERILDAVTIAGRIPREERFRGYKDVQLIWDADPLAKLADGVVPIASEFRPNSEDLCTFAHPQNAVYVFGPEDGGLGRTELVRCHRFIKIDTAHCLNLACAVATVLYDRAAKERLSALGLLRLGTP